MKLDILSPWSGVIWGVSPTISATCPTPVMERFLVRGPSARMSDVTNVVEEDVARRAEA
jgi:hypothetical protein